MKQLCRKCAGSGIYIEYVGALSWGSSWSSGSPNYRNVPCSCCNGTGWIDDEELIEVPRKYVKDEWWNK